MIVVRINVMLMDVITSPIIPQQPVPLSEQGRCYLSISASFLLFNKICVAAKRNSPVSGKIASGDISYFDPRVNL